MEPDYPALALLVRMAATAAFVLAMGWLVARARPALAAVAIAMPVVIGPGFLMLALERDAAFVMRAAENALGALAGTIAFAVVVALGAGRRPPALILGAALGAWGTAVAAAGLATGWIGNAAAFVLAYGLGLAALRNAPPAGRGGARWSPGAEGLRALAAGGLVGAVTLAAGWLGPGLSGTMIALPVGMVFVAAGVLRVSGPGRARQVMAAGARGTAALALFLVVLGGTLAAALPPVPAVLAATGAAVALAAGLGLAVRAGVAGPGA